MPYKTAVSVILQFARNQLYVYLYVLVYWLLGMTKKEISITFKFNKRTCKDYQSSERDKNVLCKVQRQWL